MKKQKLHLFARLATLSIVGAIPVMVANDTHAAQKQHTLPPIVQRTQSTNAPESGASYSYTRDSSKPLAPTYRMERPNSVPPIVSGTNVESPKINTAQTANTPNSGLLAPIGSGLIQQVARLEPAQPKIAHPFSPAKIPVAAQGSGSRAAAPAIQLPNPVSGLSGSVPAPPVISGSLIGPAGQGSVLDSGPISSPSFFDAPPATNQVPIPSVFGNVGAAGNCDGCAGGCDSCGPEGCYNPNQINCDYGTFGSVSAARRYAYLEFLFLTREDGDITNSNFNPLGEFDFSPAWRFTIGQRPDMTQGREFSYFGTSGIDNSQTTTDADGDLNALFVPAGGLVPDDLSSFFGATEQTQFKETTIHSLEFNRVRWGWDVLKSFVGFRYLYFDDQFQLDSTAPVLSPFGPPTGVTETGQQRIDAINHLFGAHIGAELFYDIGYRFSLSGLSKFGVYANVNEVDNFLVNNSTVLLDTESNDANISTTYEINVLAHYQIRQTARLRVGYNALFVGNIATVSDNAAPFVSPFTGFEASDQDDAFIHGFTFGLEVYR